MNEVTIPFNADRIVYYAVFSKSNDGKYIQSSLEYEDLSTPIKLCRELFKKNPNETHGIYQVSISQFYVPIE